MNAPFGLTDTGNELVVEELIHFFGLKKEYVFDRNTPCEPISP